MAATRIAACLLCGRTAQLYAGTAAVQWDCPDCGPFEMTVGVVSHLQANASAKAAVRAEVLRQRRDGVTRPEINVEILQALTRR